jgi:hypothetical protein
MANLLPPDLFDNWSDGVVTTVEPDQIPRTASPHGRNAALQNAGADRAVVQKRRGLNTMNGTAITGSPAIIGQREYRKLSSGIFTSYHLLVSDGGRLDLLNGDGTTSPADASTATPFTAGTFIPDFTVAKNLVFIANGKDQNKKFNGTNVQRHGIAAPAVAPTLADGGGVGLHNGTYEGFITYYNGNTGNESSAGPTAATVTVVNRTIRWTWTASTDPQVTAVRLYIRNTGTQSIFFQVAEVAIGTTTTTTSATDVSLITKGPDTAENNPPPITNYLAFYGDRLFAAGDPSNPSIVYYSKEGQPEAFDPDNKEAINQDDGSKITGLHVAHEILMIFKRTALYGLFGTDPDTWELRVISPAVGATSHRSIWTIEGITYFWSEQGLMAWDGDGEPTPVGNNLLANELALLQFDQFDKVCAAPDLPNGRLIFAVAETGKTRNTLMLPFNTRVKKFEGEWDPMDCASLAPVLDSTGKPRVYMGNYGGQILRVWDTDNDGVVRGTRQGAVSSATSTTLTDSTATFDTVGAGLKERIVCAVASNGSTYQRRRITGNTATQLTVDTAWSVTPNTTYTYVIGAPMFEWETAWSQGPNPFYKRRLRFLSTMAKSTQTGVYINVSIYLNEEVDSSATTEVYSVSQGGFILDQSHLDQAALAALAPVANRVRVGLTCRLWKARVWNYYPDQPVTLLKVGMEAELLAPSVN